MERNGKIQDLTPSLLFKRKNPQHIQIETTTRCNLKCTMCPRQTYDYARLKFDDMTLKDFEHILKKLPKDLGTISFHGLGEPLLNKDIVDIIATANGGHFNTLLVTNGLLFEHSMITNIFQSPPGQIIISMDSPDKFRYEQIRKGANYNVLVNNIKELINEKAKNAYPTHIAIQMVVSENNFSDVSNMIEFCRRHDIPSLNLVGIHSEIRSLWKKKYH